MDVKIINPFVKATSETFDSMLQLELKMGKPVLKEKTTQKFDVSGVIGMSGKAQGMIILSFTKLLALQITSKLLQKRVKIIGDELCDAIGEIANIVAGYAKQYLAEYELEISLPNVIIGSNHHISVPSGIKSVIIPFNCSLGGFAMEVALKTI